MISIDFCSSLERQWLAVEPVRLGDVPATGRTPDLFVVVSIDSGPELRIDLFGCREDVFAFEEAIVWEDNLVIGWGCRVFVVNLRSRIPVTHNLGSYFGQFYQGRDRLLVASAEHLFCLGRDGALVWKSTVLGVDGVVVDQVDGDVIRGQGEWDPPGGWRSFTISLESGKLQVPKGWTRA